jgi:peptide/nickel transport system substrate-binding protein
MGGGTADEVEDAGQLEALPLTPASVLFVALDTRVAPLDDARVRRALSAALDRDALARVTSPVARPAGSFVPMESPYRAAEVRQPDADLDLAAALLDSAGYRRAGEDIRVSADGTPLRITIASEQSARELLTFIQGQLRRVGIDARLELMEAATFYDDIQNPDRRPMAMAVTLIPDRVVDYDPEAELHSEGFLNLASYRSETVDSLIEELAASHEDADRERIFGELQRAVARDVPSLYIAYSPRILAVAPGLQGVEVDVRGPFASLEDWRVSR